MTNQENQEESLYTEMLDIHKHIFDQLKYAEAKCGIVTTISLGFFAVLARILYVLVKDKNFHLFVSPSWVDWIAILSLLTCIVLCISCLWDLFRAFNPRLDNREKDIKEPQGNIYFFEDIAVIRSDKFFEYVKEKFSVSELKGEEALLDLSNQICVLSQIASAKHRNCRNALAKIKWSFPVFVLFLIFGGLSIQAQGAVIM